MNKKYSQQTEEIKFLTSHINEKCKKFAEETENPNFGDLSWIIQQLKEIDNFIKI
jgi:hypothetical protein